MHAISWRILLVLAVFSILTPPVENLHQFILILIFSALFLLSKPRAPSRASHIVLVAFILAGLALSQLPLAPRIIERKQALLFNQGGDHYLQGHIPSAVLREARRQFFEYYPPRSWLTPDGKALNISSPSRPWSFAPSSFWRSDQYGRYVSWFHYEKLREISPGFLHTWSGSKDGSFLYYEEEYISRDQVPFLLAYDIGEDMRGGRFCSSLPFLIGEELQPQPCREITHRDVGARLFVIGFHDGRFDVSFTPSLLGRLSYILEHVLQATLFLWFLLFFFPRVSEPIKRPLGSIFSWSYLKDWEGFWVTTIMAVCLLRFSWHFFQFQFPYHLTGEDGLLYIARSHEMLECLFHGDLGCFLHGGADIFHFMPGQRYLGTVGHILFGASLGHAWVLVFCLPLVLYRILKRFWRWEVAILITLFFILLRTSPGLCIYVALSFSNLAEPNAAFFFFSGLLLSLSGRERADVPQMFLCFIEGICFSIAIVLRPELSIAVLTLYCYRATQLLRMGQSVLLFFLALGSLPAFFPLAHNYFHGGSTVLFTNSAPTVTNCPPSTYLEMLSELVRFDVAAATSTVLQQWGRWLGNPFHWLLLAGHVACCWPKWANPRLRHIPWVGFALHLPLLIFNPDGRYALIAWTVSLILTMDRGVRITSFLLPTATPSPIIAPEPQLPPGREPLKNSSV